MKKTKKRDPMACELWSNGLFRQKVQKNKKKEQKKDPPKDEY